MKLNIIIFKNVKINAFTTPNFVDLEPDVAAKQLERSLILNQDKEEIMRPYANLDMFCIGTFDDETGIITQTKPVLLLSPRELIIQIEAKKLADAKDEKEEVANV